MSPTKRVGGATEQAAPTVVVDGQVAQGDFAERACGFMWPEDIKVDVLGQHLTGKAQTYYRRQVETWWCESQTLEHAMQ